LQALAILLAVSENSAAVLRDDNKVFNSHPTEPFTIDARLDSYYLSNFERFSKPVSHPRHLVNLQADTMSCAVTKFVAITSLDDEISTYLIYILSEHTCTNMV
jgi:hypothetical protein